jgi:hypothetical protein
MRLARNVSEKRLEQMISEATEKEQRRSLKIALSLKQGWRVDRRRDL